LPTFLVEGNIKFQLEVSENKDVFFSSFKFTDPCGPMDPRLRTPVLEQCAVSIFRVEVSLVRMWSDCTGGLQLKWSLRSVGIPLQANKNGEWGLTAKTVLKRDLPQLSLQP
jgi:hypothetical protein